MARQLSDALEIIGGVSFKEAMELKVKDFTKEELQEIHRCLSHMTTGGTTPYSSLTLELKKKLHSMIDNYCEHSHKQYYERVNLYECDNCHMVML